jgi:hypothetical protein
MAHTSHQLDFASGLERHNDDPHLCRQMTMSVIFG